jgi:hypothetical protein
MIHFPIKLVEEHIEQHRRWGTTLGDTNVVPSIAFAAIISNVGFDEAANQIDY